MITPRDNYLMVARGGKGLWVPDMWEDNQTISFNKFTHRYEEDGLEWDPFGVSYRDSFPTAHKFWDDISDWRKYMPMPTLEDVDWDAEAKFAEEVRQQGQVVQAHIADGGYMLILANSLGFEDALISLIEEEDEVLDFFRVLTDAFKTYIDYAHKYLKADVISYPDDSSNGRGPFMSHETYKTLFAPFMREACEYAHSYGMLFNVHNCGDPQFILDEYLDMGVDIVNANIDSPYLREFREKHGPTALVLEGGWKNSGPLTSMDVEEEVLKGAVDEYYEKFAKDGGFIAHINCIVAMGDRQKMKRKVIWGQEESNRLRFEYYQKLRPEELEYLQQYTHGLDSMWEVMGIKD